jgi:hypothetical protein
VPLYDRNVWMTKRFAEPSFGLGQAARAPLRRNGIGTGCFRSRDLLSSQSGSRVGANRKMAGPYFASNTRPIIPAVTPLAATLPSAARSREAKAAFPPRLGRARRVLAQRLLSEEIRSA